MTGISVVILGVTLLLAMFARRHWLAVYHANSKTAPQEGLTGAQVARRILSGAGLEDVEVCEFRGMVPDHYDPSRRKVFLATRNYNGRSAAAVGVAAHEAAHALQHNDSFTPLSLRMSAVKLTQVASGLVLVGVGVALAARVLDARTGLMLVALGWGMIMVFNLTTLPVEFDASNRAKRALKKQRLVRNRKESEAVGRVLNASVLTFVGAILTSIPYLLYHLVPFFGRKPVVDDREAGKRENGG